MSDASDTTQLWRVVVACDEVQPHTHAREVKVYHNHLGWFTRVAISIDLATPRAAVAEHAAKERWPVAEILAPGQASRVEVERERDALRAVVAALPICTHCDATATREAPNLGAQYYCDDHAPSQPWTTVDLPYAAEVRAWKWMR